MRNRGSCYRNRLRIILGFVFVMYARGLNASGPQDIPTIFTIDRPDEYNIVTRVTRFRTKKVDTPYTVEVYTEEDIKNSGARHLYEFLNQVTGFQWLSTSLTEGGGSIRNGVADQQERILLLIDGHPVHIASMEHFFTGRLLPINHIKRIELLKGPASALYGKNALNGVIYIVTKSGGTSFTLTQQFFDKIHGEIPIDIIEKLKNLKDKEYSAQNDFICALRGVIANENDFESYKNLILKYVFKDKGEHIKVSSSYESFDTQEYVLSLRKGMQDIGSFKYINILSNITHFNTDGPGLIIGAEENTEQNLDVNIFTKLETPKFDWTLSYTKAEADSPGFYRESNNEISTDPTSWLTNPPFFTPEDEGNIDLFSSYLIYDSDKNRDEPWNLRIKSYFNAYTISTENNLIVRGISEKKKRSAPEKTIGTEIQYTHHFGSQIFKGQDLQLIGGISHRYENIMLKGEVFEHDGNVYDNNIFSGFLQTEYNYSENMKFVIGGRYDNDNDFDSRISPNLGVVLKFGSKRKTIAEDRNNHFRIYYGESFRVPDNMERFGEGMNVLNIVRIIDNISLEPENLMTIELGYDRFLFERSFNTHIKGSVRFFKNWIENFIGLKILDPSEYRETYSQYEPGTVLVRFENLENLEVSGVEMEIRAQYDRWIQGYINYTYLDLSKPSTYAKHKINLGVTVNPISRLSASLRGSIRIDNEFYNLYTQKRGQEEDMFFQLDGNIRTRIYKQFWLSVGSHNILDSILGKKSGFPQTGRTFFVKAEYTYNF